MEEEWAAMKPGEPEALGAGIGEGTSRDDYSQVFVDGPLMLVEGPVCIGAEGGEDPANWPTFLHEARTKV